MKHEEEIEMMFDELMEMPWDEYWIKPVVDIRDIWKDGESMWNPNNANAFNNLN